MRNPFSSEVPDTILMDAADWIGTSQFYDDVKNGKNSVAIKKSWVPKAGLSILDLVKMYATRYNFRHKRGAFMFYEWGFAEVTDFNKNSFSIAIHGPEASVNDFVSLVDKDFQRTQCSVDWYYTAGGQMNSVRVPLTSSVCHDSFYPWLPVKMKDYYNNFIGSKATVLILIGPPGSGKTSFIRNMLHETNSNGMVTYDEKLMNDDGLFVNFMTENSSFLIMEDAEVYLTSRQDGNNMMHRFLNLSDGLISNPNKKIVFSTNLPSTNDIDDALLRPGRCFDIIQFRDLSYAEAEIACKDIGKPVPAGKDRFLLTELFNSRLPSEENVVQHKIGF